MAPFRTGKKERKEKREKEREKERERLKGRIDIWNPLGLART